MEIKSIKKRLVAPYYTRQNLALVLGSNRRVLDERIKKLIDLGWLIRIRRGFYLNNYLLEKSLQKEELLEYVGGVLKYPAYVSLEYALAKYGLIPESIYTITYVTTKKTARYQTEKVSFAFRAIKQSLFWGFEERKFGQGKYWFASKEKALFDFIYFTPMENYTLETMKRLLFNARINWNNITSNEMKRFGAICQKSQSVKMILAKQVIEKEKLR